MRACITVPGRICVIGAVVWVSRQFIGDVAISNKKKTIYRRSSYIKPNENKNIIYRRSSYIKPNKHENTVFKRGSNIKPNKNKNIIYRRGSYIKQIKIKKQFIGEVVI